MPLHFSTTTENPKEHSLIVCAGTVTCKTVEEMGAGFMVFKKAFHQDKHYEKDMGWKAHLGQLLENYHEQKADMPPFVLIAKQDDYYGGIATVPNFNSHKSLSVDHKKSKNIAFLRAQYMEAVRGALQSAKDLNCPLFIQPLGIGVYGWNPHEAARMFAKVIKEVDPEITLDITIPIYDDKPGSNDSLFQDTLRQTLFQKPANKKEQFETIITSLIENIDHKKNGRWTSGKGSEKVNALKAQLAQLRDETDIDDPIKQKQIIDELERICKMERHFILFGGSPHSVQELHDLLHDQGLLPEETELNSAPKSP